MGTHGFDPSLNHLMLDIGEIIIADQPMVVSTVLGSCIAVCLYSVKGEIGGINHYALPMQAEGTGPTDDAFRYGDSAMSTLIETILATPGVEHKNLRAKIIGGAHKMVAIAQGTAELSAANIAIARRMLAHYQIPVVGEDVGGEQGRKLYFFTDSGRVRVGMLPNLKGEKSVEKYKDAKPSLAMTPGGKPRIHEASYGAVDVTRQKSVGSVRTRVLVVDDSKTIQQMLTRVIGQDESLEIAGVASSAAEAQQILARTRVDVMTLDIHMPGMDGVAFLEKLLQERSLPVIMVTALSLEEGSEVLRALALGAVDYIQKPQMAEISALAPLICEKIRGAAQARVRKSLKSAPATAPTTRKSSQSQTRAPFIAIGASTGGTEAIKDILFHLPAEIPPIVIVQHIPAVFSRSFANHLNDLCPFEVKEAEDGDKLLTGRVLVAPGGLQLSLKSEGFGYKVEVRDDPPVNRHKPSVDVLFASVARLTRGNAIGIILTGMGNDGAAGLLAMKRAGCRTIAQDEASSVVFGMPKEAISMGAADHICDLGAIPQKILELMRAKRSA